MQKPGTYPIGEKIKEARLASKKTMIQMAEELNFARQTYTYLEHGQVDPRFTVLQTIALLTDKPLSFFYDHKSIDAQEIEKLVNASRHEGIVYACLKLAELYGQTDTAINLLDVVGIDIERGRKKDVQKLKELIGKSNTK